MSTQNLQSSKDELDRVPHPSHRHAAPSAPWPWVDLDDDVDSKQLESIAPPIPEHCDHSPGRCNRCWTGYPQSRFPNWTERQAIKAKIYDAVHNYPKNKPCTCYRVDVDESGFFTNVKEITAEYGDEDMTWDQMIHEQRPRDIRLRALFIQDLSGPVLQMLGTKFNIEPFFWSSSLHWIPSRFQEEIKEKVGDHITITLTFLRSMAHYDAVQLSANQSIDNPHDDDADTLLGSQSIDTHAPLILYSNNRLLVLDLLSVHLIRNINGSTIISYHPSLNFPTTTAKYLHERIRFAGQSVYWQSMFQKSQDPTFVLLTFIWHAMYAWDEALENLYQHICSLESRVISTAEMPLTQELHVIRAHHLHYLSLLEHYTKHVTFIKNTPNPALDALDEKEREASKKLLFRECDNLLNEIKRLDSELSMQERRLKNVMALVFSTVNITDSRYMRQMTEAAVRDSAGMKQIAYLTMVFLPASFVAAIFGMNVQEINGTRGTLGHYVALALPLTIVTTWVIIAFQSKHIFPPGTSFIKRFGWPVYLINTMFTKKPQPLTQKLMPDYSLGGEDGF
ncbi:hypothetical protein BYT27DRAFT_7162598 [Phlegmacium glaucopus]|nr:hypothetical protein BYT27DRAFT_7162598 [Phlegmacium glaucopus]